MKFKTCSIGQIILLIKVSLDLILDLIELCELRKVSSGEILVTIHSTTKHLQRIYIHYQINQIIAYQ